MLADLRSISNSIGIVPPTCLAASPTTGFSRDRDAQQQNGTGPSALLPWIGPEQWPQEPQPEASIRCCQGGLATARLSVVEYTRTIRVALCQ
jgi:hypothetical protein